jgi:hypothetical protein
MKNYGMCLLLLPMLCAFSSQAALAGEAGRFDGQVGVGFITILSGDNLDPDGSEKRLADLNTAADKESTFIPVLLPSATWDIGEQGGVKLFFETEPPIDEAGSFTLGLGASVATGWATCELGAFFTPFEEVWENPYLTGVDRSTSSTTIAGLRLSANRIMGTGLGLHLVYLGENVDDDAIGALIPDMARDGSVYSIATDYHFRITETFQLTPQLSVRKGDFDGESSSYTKVKGKLKGTYVRGRLILNPEIYLGTADYDEIDRVFNQDRETDEYGAALAATYLAPFNFQDWALTGIAGYSRGDSSITFYDNESVSLGMFLSYRF